MALSSHKTPSRKQVIDELIDEKVKIKEGKKYGVNPTSADIDSSYAQMASRMRLSPDQLTKVLASKGIRADTLKSRIKAEIVWGSLVRGRFKDSLLVSDSAVRAAVKDDGKKDEDNFQYRMRPIVLIVPHGSPAGVVESRRKEAETLRSRIQSCEEASQLVHAMRNVTIRDVVVKTSADLPAPLRAILDKTPVGHLTPPETTRQGIEMVALCERTAATGDTPEQRQAREKIYAQKFQAKSKSYLEDIRRAAMIEYPHSGRGHEASRD
jgi:peptidyl-prolyl cis-trans isomerase SurA